MEPRKAEAVLSVEQMQNYQDDGYLHLNSFVPDDVLVGLQSAAAEFVEKSRGLKQSDKTLDLEPGHSEFNYV